MKNEPALLHRWAAQLEDYDFEILHRPGKNQGHVDALSRLPMDKVQFLGLGKTVLQTAEDTAQVLERIHQDGRLGVKKTLKLFRRRFEGGVRRRLSVKPLFHRARVASSVLITNPKPCHKARSSWYPLVMF